MSLGVNIGVSGPSSRLPRYQDPTRGLQQAILGNQQMDMARQNAYSQALKDHTSTAEQQTLAGALTGAKGMLDEDYQQKVSAGFEAQAATLAPEFQESISSLDNLSAALHDEHTIQYDGNGNPIPFEASPQGKAYEAAQREHNKRFAPYMAQLDQQNELAARQAQSGWESAPYDATRLQAAVQERAIQGGVGLEQAIKGAEAAAAPYRQAPMSEAQKAQMEAQQKLVQTMTDADLAVLAKDKEGSEKAFNLGKAGGVSSNSDGSVSYIDKSGRVKGYSANELKEAQKDLMKEFDNLGWGIWKDNKEIIEDVLNPLYREYAAVLTPQDINDAIYSFKDDGLIKDTLKSGTTKEDVRKVLEDRVLASTVSGGANIATVGKEGISDKEYSVRRDTIEAQARKSLTDIVTNYQSTPTRQTALASVLSTLSQDVKFQDTMVGESKGPEPKTGTKENKSLFTGDSIIDDAMKSKESGLLAKALLDEPTAFSKALESMSGAQQEKVGSILASTLEDAMKTDSTGVKTPEKTPGTLRDFLDTGEEPSSSVTTPTAETSIPSQGVLEEALLRQEALEADRERPIEVSPERQKILDYTASLNTEEGRNKEIENAIDRVSGSAFAKSAKAVGDTVKKALPESGSKKLERLRKTRTERDTRRALEKQKKDALEESKKAIENAKAKFDKAQEATKTKIEKGFKQTASQKARTKAQKEVKKLEKELDKLKNSDRTDTETYMRMGEIAERVKELSKGL